LDFPPYSERKRQEQLTEARTAGKGHGRLEKRHLQVSSRLAGQLEWPGLQQVCRLESTMIRQGKTSVEIAYAITSLASTTATAAQILPNWRGHWGIENRLHWVRDVVLREDNCRANTGHSPQNLAACRNVGLSLMRLAGIKGILSTLRCFASRPFANAKTLGHHEKLSGPAWRTQFVEPPRFVRYVIPSVILLTCRCL